MRASSVCSSRARRRTGSCVGAGDTAVQARPQEPHTRSSTTSRSWIRSRRTREPLRGLPQPHRAPSTRTPRSNAASETLRHYAARAGPTATRSWALLHAPGSPGGCDPRRSEVRAARAERRLDVRIQPLLGSQPSPSTASGQCARVQSLPGPRGARRMVCACLARPWPTAGRVMARGCRTWPAR